MRVGGLDSGSCCAPHLVRQVCGVVMSAEPHLILICAVVGVVINVGAVIVIRRKKVKS